MVAHLYLAVVIWAVLAPTIANPDIKVVCAKDSVRITWRISADLVPRAARLFLGSCMASRLDVLPNGDGDAHFDYKLDDCKFRRLMKRKQILYQNELTFRPHAKRLKPAAIVHPIQCVYKRPEGWIPPFLNPGSGVSEGRGTLVFHMELLNDQLTGIAKTNVIPLGSFMPIWAAVEQKSHQPLLLLMEECVAATTPKLQPSSQVYPIITNQGCLLESKRGTSVFLPRYHSSALVLYLQAFSFALEEEVYIHCKLAAWDPEAVDENKKTCHYVKENERWELLDDPMSPVCSCCDSSCRSRSKRRVQTEAHSFSPNSVLGPLIITDPSDSKDDSVSEEASSKLMESL